MLVSMQKAVFISIINFQSLKDLQEMNNILKILMSNVFSDEYRKLQSFLTKLNLYIDFNQKKFNFKINKDLYIIVYLKDTVFN